MAEDHSAAGRSRSRRGILVVVAALVLVAAGFAFSRQFTAAPAAPATALPTRSAEAPPPAAPARAPEATGPATPAAEPDSARPGRAEPGTAQGSSPAPEDCEEEPPPTSFTLADCDSGTVTPEERPSSPPASP